MKDGAKLLLAHIAAWSSKEHNNVIRSRGLIDKIANN